MNGFVGELIYDKKKTKNTLCEIRLWAEGFLRKAWGYNPVKDDRTTPCRMTGVTLHGVVSPEGRGGFYLHQVFSKSFCKSEFPHKSVH